jgi:hypothetical protein
VDSIKYPLTFPRSFRPSFGSAKTIQSNMLRFALTIACCCLIGTAFSLAEPLVQRPADNPYASITSAYDRLSPKDLEAIRQNRAVSSEAKPLLAEIAAALSAGRQAPAINWGDDATDTGSARSALKAYRIPSVTFAHAAMTVPNDAVAIQRTVLDLTALGRHVGRDGAFIHWMNEMNIEQKTANWLAQRLPKLTADETKNLIKEMTALPPGGDLTTALATEKAYYLDPVLADLRVLLASDSKPTSSPAELRMSGLLSEGPTTSIGLELPDGETFWLKPGQTRRGITLLSVNPSLDDAFLLREKRVLRLRLKSREINELSPEQLRLRWDRLPEKSGLRAMTGDALPPSQALEGTVRLLSMMNDFYADVLADPHRYRDQKNRDERVAQIPPELRDMAPVFVFEILKGADRSEVLRAQLAAALTARAGGKAAPEKITDPISGRPMRIIPTTGGYILESDAVFSGKPLRLTVGEPTDTPR